MPTRPKSGTSATSMSGSRPAFQIDRATFPNWEGKNNKRSFVIVGDELRFTDPHASAGGVATTIFERAK